MSRLGKRRRARIRKSASAPAQEEKMVSPEMASATKRYERQGYQETIVVGSCALPCGGEIVYAYGIVRMVPLDMVSHYRREGIEPTKEARACSCAKCGLLYDPYFPKFYDQMPGRSAK